MRQRTYRLRGRGTFLGECLGIPPNGKAVEITGSTAEAIGEAAAAAQLVLHELTPVVGSLEDAYMSLTQDSVEYHSTQTGLSSDNLTDHPGTHAAHLSPEGANR